MTVKKKADQIGQILDALKKAADGDYSENIGFASKKDDLGLIAEAINGLLAKTNKRIDSMTQFLSDLAADAGRYRNIIETIEESYFEVDLKGNLQFFNERVMVDLGYTDEDLRGMNFSELADQANTQKLYDAFHSVFLTGRSIKSFEWEILKKNKEKIDVEASIALRRDETGNPVGFRGVVRDVSQRKKAQEEIYQSEERYRTILDITEEGYIENDLTGRITFANETACRLMGYERKRLIGMHYREYLSANVAEHMHEVFQRVYITSKPELLVDYDLVRPDGTIKSYQMNVALRYDALGNACGFGVLTRDLSQYKETREALQKSEDKYRNILKNMEEAYLETDLAGNFLFFNDAFCEMLGYSGEELLQMNYKHCLEPQAVPTIFQIFHEIYLTDKPRTFINHELITKSGSKIIAEASVSLWRDASGNPAGFRGIARDVTEKIRSTLAIEKNERHLRLITDNIHDIIWTLNFNLTFNYVSPSILPILGYAPEEVFSRSLCDMVTPASYALIEKFIADKLAEESNRATDLPGKTSSYEIEMIHKNGSLKSMEVIADFNRDENGNPFEILGVTRDVTERKHAEEARRLSEEKYRNILENMAETYLETDLEGNFLFFNDSLCRVLGYSRDELQNASYRLISPPGNLQKIFDAFSEIYRTGKTKLFNDHELLAKDGSIIYLDMSIALMRSPEGNPIGFGGLGRDSTEKVKTRRSIEENERHLRLITDNIRDIIWTMDFNLKYTYLSPSILRMTGFTAEEIMRLPVKAILPPATYSMMERLLSEELEKERIGTFADHERITTFEMQMMHKNGKSIWVEISADFNRDENGKSFEIVGVTRDITERKKVAAEIKNNEQRYRLLAENVNDIVWRISMDLRFIYASPSHFRVTGFTPEEIDTMSFSDFIVPESYALVAQIISQELELETSGKPFDPNRSRNMELEIYAKGKNTIWLEVIATFNRDLSGKPTEILAVGRNITERRQMERSLAENEKRYRMIAENMNDIVWTIGMDLRFIYVSPSSTRVTGYTPEEAMARPLNELLTPESFAYATGRLAEELTLLDHKTVPPGQIRPIMLEVEAIHKDGTTFWLEVTGTFNWNSEGTITEILAVGRNITERKKVQNALHESEKRLRMIVDNMQDTIWTMDFNLQYTYLSPAIKQLTGYTIEEIKTVPLDRQLTPASMEVVAKALSEEFEPDYPLRPKNPDTSRTLELEVFRKDGSIVWQELTLTFKPDDQGNPVEILGVARDISERKKAQAVIAESEKRYRMIMENMHEIIWTTDLSMRNTYVSPSCFHLSGYTPEELMLLPLDQVITPESMILAATAVSEELTLEFSGQPVDPHRSKTIEQEILCKNGGTLWLEVTATFTRDEEGKPTGMLMAGRDISMRKKAEQEKRKLEEQLVQAQKMETVGRLAGGVAHDFNNMLSVILGYVDLAKLRLAKQHPVLKDIAEIEKAAVRSRDITTQLLAFSRKQVIEPKIIDLNDLVAHTEKALIRLIGEDIELKVLTEKHLWAILFDPSQIEQILINLAVNARDAMPDGGKLTIETTNLVLDDFYCKNHVDSRPGSYVRLTVSDNGTGMDKDTLEHIFEPFFTTKDVGKGTGLGLATVYGIVKQNNGFINVYSEPANGTTFSIYLPRTTEAKEAQEASEDELPPTGAGNILLVEDDEMVLQITRGMLESIGYSVTAVGAPGDALSLFEKLESPVDLVITDVVMPAMSGKELRNKLLEIRPETKVLFMSGYTADVIAHHGVLEEGVHFLQKPFTIKSLAGKVSDVMAKSA